MNTYTEEIQMANLTNEQINKLEAWAEKYVTGLGLTYSFTLQVELLNAMDNAVDVSDEIAVPVVQETFYQYIDINFTQKGLTK
jgi:hypothetical protein